MTDYFNPVNTPLGGFQANLDEADIIVFGNDLDETATFRSGCRHGPSELRRLAMNLETIDPYTKLDMAEILIHDLGDLLGTRDERMARTSEVVSGVIGSRPGLMIGGEHAITIPMGKLFPNYLFIIFDAHLDLRDEYHGDRWSHASAIRRVLEHIPAEHLVFIGTRAVSMEEKRLLSQNPEITVFWGHDWDEQRSGEAISVITDKVRSCEGLYLSVDMDGFDPSYVPGVGNPEPMGLTTREFFSVVNNLPRIDFADITELNPDYDTTGVSAAVAARLSYLIMAKMKETYQGS